MLLPIVKESLWFDSYMCVVVKDVDYLCGLQADMCGAKPTLVAL